jgi:hypothetical protein
MCACVCVCVCVCVCLCVCVCVCVLVGVCVGGWGGGCNGSTMRQMWNTLTADCSLSNPHSLWRVVWVVICRLLGVCVCVCVCVCVLVGVCGGWGKW